MGGLGLDSTKLFSFIGAGAGATSSAATLTALGVSSQAVPVVGQVLVVSHWLPVLLHHHKRKQGQSNHQ